MRTDDTWDIKTKIFIKFISSAMSETTLAGIPLELLPEHVREGLGRPQALELAISADAIATMFGANAELAMSKVKVCAQQAPTPCAHPLARFVCLPQ